MLAPNRKAAIRQAAANAAYFSRSYCIFRDSGGNWRVERHGSQADVDAVVAPGDTVEDVERRLAAKAKSYKRYAAKRTRQR